MDIFEFWILIAIISGTVFLLYPLTRRIGRRTERPAIDTPEDEATGEFADRIVSLLDQMNSRLAALEQSQGHLEEQQEFLESLLERKKPPVLGAGDSAE